MTEPRSASKTASVTSPRSSPSACKRQRAVLRTAIRSRSWPRSALRAGRPGGEGEQKGRQRPRCQRDRGEEVEPLLERGLRARLDRHRLEEAVGVDVRDEHEGGASVALDFEHRLEPAAALEQQAGERPDEREVARPLPVGRPAALVDPAHGFRVDPDARAEPEAPVR